VEKTRCTLKEDMLIVMEDKSTADITVFVGGERVRFIACMQI
jgi:hypothetical protein